MKNSTGSLKGLPVLFMCNNAKFYALSLFNFDETR